MELKLRHTELKLTLAISSLLIVLSLECHVSMAFVIKMTLMQTLQITNLVLRALFPGFGKAPWGRGCKLVTLTSVRKLRYSGFTLFQDEAQVKDTRFIFVFALSNSADPEPGTGYSELRYLTLKVVFSLVPNEYRIQPAVTETIGLIPFVSSKKQEAYSDRAPSSS